MANTICRICGKFFDKNGNQECPECYKKDLEEYKIVREYIINHRGVSAIDINAATGISIGVILRFLSEGRIELADKSAAFSND